ncbi:MAG: division/cell wall cluster transcriptional repressor MraZ [Armatimonadota bacterium]|nr:division/cell wall cluster transcriptional repressor MraZ [Armatimonadota bacterium]
MFRGGHAHNLDEKGRVIIPQKFRLLLGEKFVLTKGLNGCLWIFTEEGFRELDERLKAQPLLDHNAVLLQRFFSGEAVDCSTDSQGRVAIPANLREYAGIDKETMIIGAGNKIEIWSKMKWDDFNSALTDELLSTSAKEVGLG